MQLPLGDGYIFRCSRCAGQYAPVEFWINLDDCLSQFLCAFPPVAGGGVAEKFATALASLSALHPLWARRYVRRSVSPIFLRER